MLTVVPVAAVVVAGTVAIAAAVAIAATVVAAAKHHGCLVTALKPHLDFLPIKYNGYHNQGIQCRSCKSYL